MKKIIYALRTELSDMAGFVTNVISTALVLFFVMLYFGSYYGSLKSLQTIERYGVDIVATYSREDIEKIKALKGYLYCELRCEEHCHTEPDVNIHCYLNYSPEDFLMPEGIPMEENDDPNYAYVSYEEKSRLGDIGDELILGINQEKKEVKVFKKNKKEEGYELFRLTVDGTLGKSIGPSAVCISPSFFFENLTPSSISVYFDAVNLTEKEFNDNVKALTEIIGEPTLVMDFDFKYGQALEFRRITAALLFIFGMISLLFLYSYTLSKKIKRFSVIKICGATKGSVFAVIAAGSLFTFVLSFFAAIILGKLLNLILFEPAFGFNTFNLEIIDYLKFFIITLMIYSIVSFIYIFKFIKNSAISVYRRSE